MNLVPESAEFPFRALGEGQPPDWQGISLALNPLCKLLHIPCDLHCIPNTKKRIRSSHKLELQRGSDVPRPMALTLQ